jgi:hypothetical protein
MLLLIFMRDNNRLTNPWPIMPAPLAAAGLSATSIPERIVIGALVFTLGLLFGAGAAALLNQFP